MTAADDAETAPRRGYRKGAERRTQILDQMIRMVAEQGVDASSPRSVAEALGITHAALRHYFPSRDELLLAVYREHEVREQGAPDRLKSAIGDMREVPAATGRSRGSSSSTRRWRPTPWARGTPRRPRSCGSGSPGCAVSCRR